MYKRLGFSVLSALVLAACGSNGGGNVAGGGSGEFLQPGGAAANQTPTVSAIGSQSAPIGHDFALDLSSFFSDADGDALTYTVSFSPDNGDFTVQNGVITGRTAVQGSTTVSVSASDGTASVSDSFIINSDFQQTAIQQAFAGAIDISALADYETIEVPDYIQAPNQVANPVTDAGATLGRVLFYDAALSVDDTVSCSVCHRQSHGFSDPGAVSTGVEGGQTGRHSMRLINTIFSDETAFFWDERAANLEAQVTQPIRDHNEHGFSGQNGRPGFADLTTKLEAIDYYQELFAFVYGTPEVTEERMQSALAQFVNSIVSFDSRFDEGRAQVTDPFFPFPNFTADENEGKNIYMSGPEDDGAGCRRCHADPEFSVFADSGHIGVFGVAGDPTATDFTNVKSPSLRELFKPGGATNGPFMHDGSMTTMREILDHYDAIPVPADPVVRDEFMASIDPQLVQMGQVERLNLTDVEKDQIEAFLRTLTGQNVYTDPKWSDPF